jgi:NTP pyrophosphatase (non-canonical NTP hydrolase)
MDFDQYQKQVTATKMSHSEFKSLEEELQYWALCLAGETGEVCNTLKKLRHGHTPNFNKLLDEAGDVLWYLTALVDTLEFVGPTLDSVAQQNLQKLRSRYPDGFDAQRSINRNAHDAG